MVDQPRIQELESAHATWRRRRRWRVIFLLLVPLLAGGGLVWANRAEMREVRDSVAQGFAQVAGQPVESLQDARIEDLLTRLAQLGQEVAELRGVRDQLGAEQAQRAALEQQLGQTRGALEAERAGLIRQVEEVTAALDAERAARTQLELRLAERTQALEAERAARAEAEARLERAETEIRALRKVQDRLQAELDARGDQLEQAQTAQTAALASRLATAEAEIAGLRKIRDRLQAELDASADRIAALAEAQADPARAAAEVSGEALDRIDGLNRRVASLERELAASRAGNDSLRAERDTERQRVAALTRDLEMAERELAKARQALEAERERGGAERGALIARVAELEAEVARLSREREIAQARLDELDGRLGTALARARELDAEMSDVRASLDRARRGAVDAVAASIAQAGTQTRVADRIEVERDDTRSRIDELTRRIEALELESRRLREERETARAEREALDRRLAELAEEKLRLQAERDAATRRLASLEQDLAAARSRAIAASQEAERARSLLTSTQGDVEQKLQEAVRRAEAAAAETLRLRGDLSAVEAAKLALTGQLTGLEVEKRTLTDAGVTLAETAAPIDLLRGQLGATPVAVSAADLDRVVLERAAQLQRILAAAPGTDDADYLNGNPLTVPSAVLFDVGSATIKPEGKPRLVSLAGRLKDMTATLPADLPWIIRVDGHTDSLPIRAGRYRTNLELSTARAVAVADFLMRQGVPAERLVPAGFADHVPVAVETDEASRALNRRIEIKLGLR